VTLPPEVLDKILEHIPTYTEGRQTLIACALVATWWAGPSQRRLFSSVSIDENNHQRWVNGVVQSVSRTHCRNTGTECPMRDLAQVPGGCVPLLRNTHILTLSNIRVEHIGANQFRVCFSAFRETLTCLSLRRIAASFGTFVALVDYFPNITTLRVHSFVPEPEEGPVPTLSRPYRGKVLVRGFRGDRLEFFDRFTKLDLECEELEIGPCAHSLRFLESALQISPATVKFLGLITEIGCEQRLPTYQTAPPPTHV